MPRTYEDMIPKSADSADSAGALTLRPDRPRGTAVRDPRFVVKVRNAETRRPADDRAVACKARTTLILIWGLVYALFLAALLAS